jgi:hypothetical protein
MSLKNFIIKEELSTEHSARYLLFKERYHNQVLLDLKKTLEKEWTKDVNGLSKHLKLKDEDLQLALLQNPKALVQLLIEPKDEKIVSSRHRDTIEVSPSVKIPLLYKNEERDLIIKELLASAEAAFKSITHTWDEIFKVEKKGRATPWFKVVTDHDELRLQLALSDGGQEMYKTLYAIRVEYGKKNSKTKDFDRVYLISL